MRTPKRKHNMTMNNNTNNNDDNCDNDNGNPTTKTRRVNSPNNFNTTSNFTSYTTAATATAVGGGCCLPWHMRLLAAASPGFCDDCNGIINNGITIVSDKFFDNLRINDSNEFICGRVNNSSISNNDYNDNYNRNDNDKNESDNNRIFQQQVEQLQRQELLLSQEEGGREEGYNVDQNNHNNDNNVDEYYNSGKSIISPSILGPMLSLSSSSNINTTTIQTIMDEYRKYCYYYGCDANDRFNAGVLTTLRYSLPTLRISGNFTDCDMLALCEILRKYCNSSLSYIRRLDFSVPKSNNSKKHNIKKGSRGFGSHGAFCLAKLLQRSRYVQQVFLQRNRIGPYGATAIFLACSANPTIHTLVLRRCRIGEKGALAFADTLLHPIYKNENKRKQERNINDDDIKTSKDNNVHPDNATIQKSTATDDNNTATATATATTTTSTTVNNNNNAYSGLLEVDISANSIGFKGCVAVERAVLQRQQYQISSPHIDLEGNLVLQEVMNGITHGLGLILGLVGAWLLLQRVIYYHDTPNIISSITYNNNDPTMIVAPLSLPPIPLHVLLSCAVYSASLIVLYTSSTLFHSFYSLQNTKYIFEVMDKCAIYILIAGSYTPFMQVILQGQPRFSILLLGFLWICALCGIYIEAALPIWKHKAKFSLSMYIGMGWTAIICMPDIMRIVPAGCSNCIVLGGVAYTSGVPFFVRNNNLDHSIWHLFVLAGSIFHWGAIYFYVVPYGMAATMTATAAAAAQPQCE